MELDTKLIINKMKSNQGMQSAEQKPKNRINPSTYSLSSDLQYQIACSMLRKTSNQLFQQEMHLISRSNQLIDELVKKRQGDLETTLDSSKFQDALSISDIKHHRFQRNRRHIKGRPQLNCSQSANSFLLRQIQENCSQNTLTEVKKLFREIKVLKKTISSLEVFQEKYHRKTEMIENMKEENFNLKNKLNYAQEKINNLTEQLKLASQLSKKTESFETPENQLKKVKSYIQEKQSFLMDKLKKLEKVQVNIQKSLQLPIKEEPCLKCCEILKRIKISILNYRSYLNQEAQQMDKLYHSYKQSLFKIHS